MTHALPPFLLPLPLLRCQLAPRLFILLLLLLILWWKRWRRRPLLLAILMLHRQRQARNSSASQLHSLQLFKVTHFVAKGVDAFETLGQKFFAGAKSMRKGLHNALWYERAK